MKIKITRRLFSLLIFLNCMMVAQGSINNFFNKKLFSHSLVNAVEGFVTLLKKEKHLSSPVTFHTLFRETYCQGVACFYGKNFSVNRYGCYVLKKDTLSNYEQGLLKENAAHALHDAYHGLSFKPLFINFLDQRNIVGKFLSSCKNETVRTAVDFLKILIHL